MERKIRYWVFGFALLAITGALSSALLDVHEPELYCSNGTNTSSDCFEGWTLYVNTSLVCTTSNGLCNNTGVAVGGDGWSNTTGVVTTSSVVNINGLWMCYNGSTGIITVNQTFAEVHCYG